MKRGGFTLIELLITVVIIGFLSTVGSATYSTVRSRARDSVRVSDMSAIRSAIELSFEQNGFYPAAPQGVVLGSEEGKAISDGGITPFGKGKGIVYMQPVPFNVLPGGVPYLYYSKNDDGTPCSRECPHYEVAFSLEKATGTLAGGPHLLTDEGIQGEEAGTSGTSAIATLTQYVPSAEEIAAALGSAEELAELARDTADRPDVQAANTMVVAPLSILGAVASFIAAISGAMPFGSVGQFAFVLLAQPFGIFAGRKRQGWGVVYHAGTKLPIDLATVRLIDTKTNRVVATKATDKDGRFAFAPKAGEYRIEVVKPGFIFPATSLAAASEDGPYANIYHGTLIRAEDGGVLTVNVPLDPEKEPATDVPELLSARNRRSLRKAGAFLGPFFGALALIVTPSLSMLLLFLLQVFFYQLFKRLAEPPTPRSQGVVYDIDTRKPIAGAVVRVLSLPYHKVLDSKLTDSRGRYGFNVGAGLYELTAVKPEYEKTETDAIDLTAETKPAWIASDLPMRKAGPAGKA